MAADSLLRRAADWIRHADGILITAGAGIGVDSRLPDFRGSHGFWRAYPALEAKGLSFIDIANASLFKSRPELVWGFYGHRLNLYRATAPHAGFQILRNWAATKKNGAFVYTSSVDGQFQKAGFEGHQVLECHGSIHYLQCSDNCAQEVWPAHNFQPEVDERRCLLTSQLPVCPKCGSVARPNILMFSDDLWIDQRLRHQRMKLERWLLHVEQLVVVELGAGQTIPTVRNFSERHGPRVVRVNPTDHAVDPHNGIGIQGTALTVLVALENLLGKEGR